MSRTATKSRITSESEITVTLDLDGAGLNRTSTGVGLYDHMLTALSRHSLIDLDIQANGDVHIDGHHVVKDTVVVLGQALGEALEDKHDIRRYADATVPLDETLAHYVVDVAGHPYVVCSGEPEGQAYARIGGSGVTYAGSMIYHVFESLGLNAGLCIHLRLLAGRDSHHIIKVEYEALARALRGTIVLDPRVVNVPSAKGTL